MNSFPASVCVRSSTHFLRCAGTSFAALSLLSAALFGQGAARPGGGAAGAGGAGGAGTVQVGVGGVQVGGGGGIQVGGGGVQIGGGGAAQTGPRIVTDTGILAGDITQAAVAV